MWNKKEWSLVPWSILYEIFEYNQMFCLNLITVQIIFKKIDDKVVYVCYLSCYHTVYVLIMYNIHYIQKRDMG